MSADAPKEAAPTPVAEETPAAAAEAPAVEKPAPPAPIMDKGEEGDKAAAAALVEALGKLRAGEADAAEGALTELRFQMEYHLACCNAKKGNRRLAMRQLSNAIHLGFRDTGLLAVDADLESLRDVPAFDRLSEKITRVQNRAVEKEKEDQERKLEAEEQGAHLRIRAGMRPRAVITQVLEAFRAQVAALDAPDAPTDGDKTVRLELRGARGGSSTVATAATRLVAKGVAEYETLATGMGGVGGRGHLTVGLKLTSKEALAAADEEDVGAGADDEAEGEGKAGKGEGAAATEEKKEETKAEA